MKLDGAPTLPLYDSTYIIMTIPRYNIHVRPTPSITPCFGAHTVCMTTVTGLLYPHFQSFPRAYDNLCRNRIVSHHPSPCRLSYFYSFLFMRSHVVTCLRWHGHYVMCIAAAWHLHDVHTRVWGCIQGRPLYELYDCMSVPQPVISKLKKRTP
jgi:hypothetical protein